MIHFLKKKAEKKDYNILPFPIIEPKNVRLDVIAQNLHSGNAIWTWYSIPHRPTTAGPLLHFEELRGLERGFMDALSIYRIEDQFLCRYDADINPETKEPVLRLEMIWPNKNSVLAGIIDTYLKPAYRVYYDPDHLTNEMKYYAHDVYSEDVSLYLQTHDYMHIGKEHFKNIEE